MRVSHKLACVLMGAALSFSASGREGVGSGTRGGGHVVDVDSTPYLMDLVSQAVCEWKNGSAFIQELPALDDTLKKLERLDWYFASDLKEEIKDLNFCMTGPLYKVSPYDRHSITNPAGERTRQAGYRLYGNAFIDTNIYNHMDDANKAMLIIHETMHSYLAMSLPERSLKLRSFVKALDKVRQGEIVTREKLHYAMRMNNISFPTNVASLDEKKDVLIFLKSSLATKKEIIKRSNNIEGLIELDVVQELSLASWDAYRFGSSIKRLTILKEALLATMQDLSATELEEFLAVKELKSIDLIRIATGALYSFSEEQKQAILGSSKFSQTINAGFDEYLKESLEIKDYLVTVSADFQQLVIGGGSEPQALVSLSRATHLPERLSWLVNTMVLLHKNNALNVILDNDKFYVALGLKVQKAQLKSMKLKFPREKDVALEKLENFSATVVALLFDSIKNNVGEEAYSQILKNVDFNRF